MKISNFFLWCAGSDTELLAHCSQKERNKHIGFGSLVLIPAVLAFVSMSFALSTISGLENSPFLYYLVGTVWALVIFSFDRFIVSTHRRKKDDKSELKNPAFFLRLGFALILGIVISHPLVMLYFDGSIQDQIADNVRQHKQSIQQEFDQRIENVQNQINYLDSLEQVKEQERNAQALVVAKEIDGEVIKNAKGEIVTTGLYGKGPSAENKIRYLEQLETELHALREKNDEERITFRQNIKKLETRKDSAVHAYAVSTDYLKRELALEQLKESNPIVGTTQFMLILLFVLVDILPFIFKTFAPFGMYDQIVSDDAVLLHEMDNASRKEYLQKVYREINAI